MDQGNLSHDRRLLPKALFDVEFVARRRIRAWTCKSPVPQVSADGEADKRRPGREKPGTGRDVGEQEPRDIRCDPGDHLVR
jgi:hypothetical protein